MSDNVVYSDKLLEIKEHSVLFRDYYIPFGHKRVNFADVESVTIVTPTLSSGKYRFYGTGDFRTWFPLDGSRSSRDKIFIMKLQKKWWRIGFTVEDSQAVARILRESCYIIDKQTE